jgi:putative DNA-invertase from lambdoid prophage Rac
MIPLLVALYIRVSTAEQNADLQERELREYAAARGWTVAVVYSEVASGADTARPQLAKLIRDARARKFAAVLVWKLDRFGRSGFDCIHYIQQLAEFGVRFVAVTQSLDIETATPQGTLLMTLLAAIAEFERSMIRERTTAGRKRFATDFAAGRVGKDVHTRSGKDLPMGRPRSVFDRNEALRLREQKDDDGKPLSYRAIATRMGISRTTAERAVKSVSRGKGAPCPA